MNLPICADAYNKHRVERTGRLRSRGFKFGSPIIFLCLREESRVDGFDAKESSLGIISHDAGEWPRGECLCCERDSQHSGIG